MSPDTVRQADADRLRYHRAMRLVRLSIRGRASWGEWLEQEGRSRVRLWTAPPYLAGHATRDEIDVGPTVCWLAPVVPSKILCVGRNYRAHAKELGNEVPKEPLFFLKPPSAILAHQGLVGLPPESQRVEHEGELGIVIGKRLSRASREEALEGVFGLTCANDVTARDLQKRDVQFTRAKGFDTFCPCGPWVVTDANAEAERDVRLAVNGEVRQHGNTRDMLWKAGELLAAMSCAMTLEPGDLVLTGTPTGVGPLLAGDRVTLEISGVGTLEHGVIG